MRESGKFGFKARFAAFFVGGNPSRRYLFYEFWIIDVGGKMQALMLAAGMGQRLKKLTDNNTKCMIEVAGEKIIDRAVEAIKLADIKKFILVVGHKGENLKNYILERHKESGIDFQFIYNKDYAASNNIYSLYLAKKYLEKDDTLLLESDLVFDKSLIEKVVDCRDENVAVVAKYESWMDGTVVTLGENRDITQFIDKVDINLDLASGYFKTVNIYKFSREFSKSVYIPFLEAHMKVCGLNSYYETVLKVVTHIAKTSLKAFFIGDLPWYEIDDSQDLDIAEVMFSTGKRKYENITAKFGGYWRYAKILDFCYLVNPYFPPERMVKRLQKEFPKLLACYPSGLSVQNMNAERIFNVDKRYILMGNGAAELINALGLYINNGTAATSLPTFNEYVRCFRNAKLTKIDNSQWNYTHNMDILLSFCGKSDYIIVVSPDNPSGSLLTKREVLTLAEEGKKRGTRIVIDESFIDFADKERRYTLFDNAVLEEYPNLIVIKSISKSYGVPALRLGVLACSDLDLIAKLRDLTPVWNINSFAEYYLQIYNLFAKDYAKACDKIAAERGRFIGELQNLKSVKVYPSQANFIMIDLQETDSREFCVEMLDRCDILIKDLSVKDFFEGKNFIRVAVRDTEDNDKFLKATKKILGRN